MKALSIISFLSSVCMLIVSVFLFVIGMKTDISNIDYKESEIEHATNLISTNRTYSFDTDPNDGIIGGPPMEIENVGFIKKMYFDIEFVSEKISAINVCALTLLIISILILILNSFQLFKIFASKKG